MIREALEKDYPAIIDIYNEAIENDTASFEEIPLSLEEGTAWLQNSRFYKLLVYEKDSKVVGFISLSPFGKERETAYEITAELSVYIDTTARGMGIGAQLMKAVIDAARNETAIETIISGITEGNMGSIALQEKMGFVYCGKFENVGRKKGQLLSVLFYQKHIYS